ncbi:MAG: hypothetical protein KatS3mg102_1931 [Planctomycetota bacterium]|nr:MAG: hypothetical protein KatS3mg102_1931 [Planctomycetota bacterium]
MWSSGVRSAELHAMSEGKRCFGDVSACAYSRTGLAEKGRIPQALAMLWLAVASTAPALAEPGSPALGSDLPAGGAAVRAVTQPAIAIDRWEQAQRAFLDWQQQLFTERERVQRGLRNRLRREIAVPPPPGLAEAGVPQPVTVTVELPSWFGAGGLLPPVIPGLRLQAEVQPPTIRVHGGGELAVGKMLVAERRWGVAFSARDGSLAFREATAFQLGVGVGGARGPELNLAYGVELFGHEIEAQGLQGKLAIRHGWLGGSVGVDGEGRVSVAGRLGPEFELGRVARVELGVGVELSAPVRVTQLQFGSPFGLEQSTARLARQISRWLEQGGVCSLCGGRGQLRCRQCGDARAIRCSECGGTGLIACERCAGTGELSCPPVVACTACGGEGWLSCPQCGGSGRVTISESEPCQSCGGRGGTSRTVWVTCPICGGAGGVDFDGDGVLDSACPPTVEQEQWEECFWCGGSGQRVSSRQVSCPACGGSGRGARCDRCNGTGQMLCPECAGSGAVGCFRCGGDGRMECEVCEGTGRLRCPNCEGEPIRCRLCEGRGRTEAR